MKIASTVTADGATSPFVPPLTTASAYVPGSIIAAIAAGERGGARMPCPAPLPSLVQPVIGSSTLSPMLQQLLAKNDRVADGFNLLSTTIEFASAGSDMAACASPLADGLAFSASGLSFAAKIDKEDYWGAAAAGIKLTGTVAALAENYFFPGNTALTTAAGALKIGGMLVDLIAPDKPEVAIGSAGPSG